MLTESRAFKATFTWSTEAGPCIPRHLIQTEHTRSLGEYEQKPDTSHRFFRQFTAEWFWWRLADALAHYSWNCCFSRQFPSQIIWGHLCVGRWIWWSWWSRESKRGSCVTSKGVIVWRWSCAKHAWRFTVHRYFPMRWMILSHDKKLKPVLNRNKQSNRNFIVFYKRSHY